MSFKDDDDDDQESHKQYYLPTVEIKDYNVLIDGRKIFHQLIKNDLKTYDNIRKIATGDDYTTGCFIYYLYLKRYYKLIAIDLSRQHKLNADPKAIQFFLLEIKAEPKVHQCFSLMKKQNKQF